VNREPKASEYPCARSALLFALTQPPRLNKFPVNSDVSVQSKETHNKYAPLKGRWAVSI